MKNAIFIVTLGCILINSSATHLWAQRIFLDPGHGYNVDGSNGDGRTHLEIQTNVAVGLKLRDKLSADQTRSWTVLMSRENNNNGSNVSLAQRTTMANDWNADLYLSIHCNAGGGTGTETFWCDLSLSGAVSADRDFAQKIQSNMSIYGQWTNRRVVEDNAYLGYHLWVLRYSVASSALNEIGFVDNSSDALKLSSDSWRNTFADAYLNGIKEHYGSTVGFASVSQGVTVTPSPVIHGNNFTTSFTLKEVQGSSIAYESIVCAILKSDNTHLRDMEVKGPITISAVGTYNYTSTEQWRSTDPAGSYKAVARGKVPGGNWFDFTTTGSGTNNVSFNVDVSQIVLSVSPSFELNFGNVAVGQSKTMSITITNTILSTANLTVAPSTPTNPFQLLNGTSLNLSPGNSYTFDIKFAPISTQTYDQNWMFIHNATNFSNPWSISLKGTGTILSEPPTVQTLTATGIACSTVTLNGNINPNNLTTTAWFEYSQGSGLVNPNTTSPVSITTGQGVISLSQNVSGLSPSVQYYYRVVANNSEGTSKGEIQSFTTTPCGAPIVHTTVATDIKADRAYLNGTINSNGGNTRYYFEWGTTTAYDSKTDEYGPGYWTDDHPVQYLLTGLNSSTTYHFRLVGENGNEITYGEDVTFTTLSSPSVTTSQATNITATSATLNGVVNPNGVITTIWFNYGKKSDLSDGSNTSSQLVGSGTSDQIVRHNLTNLTPSTTYYYRILAASSSSPIALMGSILSFITINTDQSPMVSIISPINGQTFTISTITVQGTAFVQSPGTILEVQVKVNNGNWETANGTTIWEKQISLQSGNNTIKARAIDNANQHSEESQVNVNYSPIDPNPTIAITNPPDNFTSTNQIILVEGTASDQSPGYVSLVEIKLNSGEWETAEGTTSWSKELTIQEGNNDVSARAKDNANQYSIPANINVTFNPNQQVLSVSPAFREVGFASGTISFAVNNIGTGTMNWTADENESWLNIVGGTNGMNTGTIAVDYEENSGGARIGIVTVAAVGAKGSPQGVEIRQASAQYTITTSSNPSNGGTTTGDGTYEVGSQVTVTATPNDGWSFINWIENGNQVSTNPSYTFIMPSNNRNITANFYPWLSAPQILYPAYGDADIPLDTTFLWESVDNAASYEMQIAQNEQFTFKVQKYEGITDTSFQIPDDSLKSFTLYWCRVRSRNQDTVSTWSLSVNFSTIVVSITDETIFQRPYAISQNYPNPFNPTTNIKFSLPKAEYVNLVIYDNLGREIKRLVEEYKPAGNHNIEFNAENLSSGIYYYRLTAGEFTETKKMLLLR